MPKIKEQVKAICYGYSRKGGKTNRSQQYKRIHKLVEFAEENGVHYLDNLGKQHVKKFWQKNDNMSEKTLYYYWLSFCVLWKLADKNGLPPKPTKIPLTDNSNGDENGCP